MPESEPTDLELLERWRDGDATAGKALFQRHFSSIFRFFETKCPDEADDLVQTTFLRCMHAREQFRAESSFRTYLFMIARNELYRLLDSRYRRAARLDFDASSIAEIVSTPGTKLARNQEHQRLVEAMQQVPVDQQVLLELHYWEDMDIAQLAEVFEVPTATIRTRLHRARKALRERLDKAVPQAVDSLETMDVWARQFGRG